MKADRIKKAYQVLKDYKNGTSFNKACSKQKLGYFKGALKELGLEEALKKRNPTTQDAIDCLEWLSAYNRDSYYRAKERYKDVGMEAKPYITGTDPFKKPVTKTKRTFTKHHKNVKKMSFFWGLVKLEW
jgi:hypothetical protein